jgi:hypothetical protein
MGRGATALAGAAGGAAIGALLLVTTHPTSAYTNDAYREGASAGFVLRYWALGIAAAFLIRALRRRWRPPLAALCLTVVAALAIVPPLLDEQTESEKRRAAAVAIDDPEARERAEFRAGAIDGCVKSTTRELAQAPDAPDIDVEDYCTCIMDRLFAANGFDLEEMQGTAAAIQAGSPPPRFQRIARACAKRA